MSAVTFTRARLLPKNHTLTATSVTVTPTPVAGYPASNLKNPNRTALCKVAGTSFKAVINLATSPMIKAVAFTGLGCSTAATVRIKANTSNSFTAPLYDSYDQPLYPPAGRFGEGLFGEYGFGGYIAAADAKYWRPVKVIYLADIQPYNWWEITITDTDGSGYISMGIIGLCEVVEFARNFSIGWKFAVADTTVYKKTSGGRTVATRPGTLYVQADLPFGSYPDETRWDIDRRLKNIGDGASCFLALHPNTADNEAMTTLYGSLKYSGLTDAGFGRNSFNIKFEEQPTPPSA